jgi:hypothetical protein
MFGYHLKPYRTIDDLQWVHLFSYWIFFWFLFYYPFTLIPSSFSSSQLFSNLSVDKTIKWIQKYANPALTLWIALVYEIFVLLLFILHQASPFVLVKFFFIIILIKIIPLYLLRNRPILLWNDLYTFLGHLAVYLFYMFFLIDANPYQIYRDTFQAILKGENKTPFYALLSRVFPN